MISNDLNISHLSGRDTYSPNSNNLSDIEDNVEDERLDIDELSDNEVGLVSVDEIGDRPRSTNNLDDGELGAYANEGENVDVNADGDNPNTTKVEPKRKIVKHPRPKLDLEKLKGPRGLLALDDAFKDFKFRGSGHEKEDLDALMLVYEHWAHRLFPIFKFNDCLEQLERLGQKREVQTLINKIRLGMHSADDHVELFDDDDDDDMAQNQVAVPNPGVPSDDVFDSLLEEANTCQLVEKVSTVASQAPDTTVTLTQEQRERMEANRRAAEAKRTARLRALQQQEEISDPS